MSDFYDQKSTLKALAAICGSGKLSHDLEKLLISAHHHVAALQARLTEAHVDYKIQVDAIVALQDRLDAVKPYLEHKVVCVSWRGRDCNCGLAAALKQEQGS